MMGIFDLATFTGWQSINGTRIRVNIIEIQHVFSIITIMALRQLVHLATPMYGYILLEFKNPKSAKVTTRAINIINTEQETLNARTWKLSQMTVK